MAYQTYITEALVCGSYDSQTSDKSFLLFAREAGMVYANAKSVREERSKQRFALQDCSHVRATLVRGKSGWKIAGVEPIQNLYSLTETREARAFVRNIILLLRRVMHGETVYAEIFDDVINACLNVEKYSHKTLEHVLSLRILHSLGYVAPSVEYAQFLDTTIPYHRIDSLTENDVQVCKDVVDHALMQSHL